MTHPRVLDEQNILLRLDNLEMEQRRLDALVTGWARSGNTDPYFTFLRANEGHFDNPILLSARLNILSSITISNNTFTGIAWESSHFSHQSGSITFSTSNPTRVYLADSGGTNKGFLFFGHYRFDDSTVGVREIRRHITFRDGSTAIQMMDRDKANGFFDRTWCIPIFDSGVNIIDYYEFEVFQNSGGNLGLDDARIAILRYK